MKKFFDTNILLQSDLSEELFESKFVISSETFKELESIKNNSNKTEELRYKARKAVRFLEENSDKYEMVIATQYHYDILEEFNMILSPDNVIIACAYNYNQSFEKVIFVSNDLLCKMIAKNVFKLEVKSISNKKDIYKGYIYIEGYSDYINDYMNNLDYSKLYTNQYIITKNLDDNKTTEMRYDGEKFVSLRLPSSGYIKGKNSLQRCALDLLSNKDITTVAILGGYGSGKTFLAMQMALYNISEKALQSKILGVREASGEGKEIGYLKGTFEDKTGNFFKPMAQQLKGGDFELEHLIQCGILETNIPFYMKGTTYNDTVIIVDEAEDLKESQLKLIGTRLGKDSKIYFSGDYKQSLIDKSHNNALVRMCQELKGNPMFGCIFLDEDVRSETSKMFANLFE